MQQSTTLLNSSANPTRIIPTIPTRTPHPWDTLTCLDTQDMSGPSFTTYGYTQAPLKRLQCQHLGTKIAQHDKPIPTATRQIRDII